MGRAWRGRVLLSLPALVLTILGVGLALDLVSLRALVVVLDADGVIGAVFAGRRILGHGAAQATSATCAAAGLALLAWAAHGVRRRSDGRPSP